MTRYSWTQPICEACWRDREPGREPMTLQQPEVEECCLCGSETASGIYIRVDPATVSFPTLTKEGA